MQVNVKIIALLLLLSTKMVHAQDTTRVSLLFVGDIMQHDSQINDAYDAATQSYQYAPCFQYVAPYLRQPDLTIGNLELTLAGPPYKGYPQFSAPDALAYTLRDVGFDILATANNHSLDRRKRGLERTITVLDSVGLLHTGTFKDSLDRASRYPLVIEKNGIRLALLNYTYGTNGIPATPPNIVNPLDTALIRQDVRAAQTMGVDAIVLFAHWGSEYQSQPNANQKMLAEFCRALGVKLIIGAHPHVLQPMYWHQATDQLVAYSLGNFVSGQRTRYRDGGAMLYVDLEKVSHDSATQTRIAGASYQLEWVHRDSKGNYTILPLPQFEQDSSIVIGAARAQLRQFAADSRALFKKFNQNIKEVSPTAFTFRIVIDHYDSAWAASDLLTFYNFNESEEQLVSAVFEDEVTAFSAWRNIVSRTSYTRAYVVARRQKTDSARGKDDSDGKF